MLFATLGAMVMISANDLISLYLGLELLSLPLYVLAAFNRDNGRSAEAGLKYFVLGALASGLLLYGSSLVYGFAGTTNFDRLGEAFSEPSGVSAGVDRRRGLRHHRPGLQGLGGALPHVDAGRLRRRADAGDGLLRLRPEGRGHRAAGARAARPLRRPGRRSGSR